MKTFLGAENGIRLLHWDRMVMGAAQIRFRLSNLECTALAGGESSSQLQVLPRTPSSLGPDAASLVALRIHTAHDLQLLYMPFRKMGKAVSCR